MLRRCLFLLFLLFPAAAAWAVPPPGQNSIRVVFTAAPARNTTIGAFVRQGTLYGSLNDLAAVLMLRTSSDPAVKKLEVSTRSLSISVTANNAFVVLTGADSNTSVRQLPYRVLFGANAHFVPVVSFLPVLNALLTEELSIDEAGSTITVGKPEVRSAFDITGMVLEEKDNGTSIRLISQKPIKNHESWLKPAGDFTWLYITLDDARADSNAIRQLKPAGRVKEVLVFPYPASVQFIVKIDGKASTVEPVTLRGSNDIIFAVHIPAPTPPAEVQPPPGLGKDLSEALDRERSRWKLDCIVIDAGHGGDDPGTIGVTRTKEKDITLAIALKLGRLIEKNMPNVKVVYTRKTDEFIELYKRGQIANAAGGKLFISIHCNAAARKPSAPNGFEIYLLRPGKTENALRIAARENEVVKLEKDYETRYQTLTEERFILLTMAQSAYVKYSEKFAEILVEEMGKQTDIQDNGVKQAGFYVLVGASMPNVLIETGYLSNRHDEKILRSGKGQQKMAEQIFAGIKRFKQEYEKALTEGKETE